MEGNYLQLHFTFFFLLFLRMNRSTDRRTCKRGCLEREREKERNKKAHNPQKCAFHQVFFSSSFPPPPPPPSSLYGAVSRRWIGGRPKLAFSFYQLQMGRGRRAKRSRRAPICRFKRGRSRSRGCCRSPSSRYRRRATTWARSRPASSGAADAEDRTWGRTRCRDTCTGSAGRSHSSNAHSARNGASGKPIGSDTYAANTWTKSGTWRHTCSRTRPSSR